MFFNRLNGKCQVKMISTLFLPGKHIMAGAVLLVLVASRVVPAADGLSAQYLRVNSGEPWEASERVSDYADVKIVLEDLGELVFWRGYSYLPYWQTPTGQWLMDEAVPRSGDGTAQRPDKINRFSRVRIIENTAARVVVHWRYIPDFAKTRFADFVDEYFTVYPDGVCIRTVNCGTEKLDDWLSDGNTVISRLRLASGGITALESAWQSAPSITIGGGSTPYYRQLGFNQRRRCYELKCLKNYLPSELSLSFSGDIHNPVLVVRNWGDAGCSVADGGTRVDFKSGHVNRADSMDLVLWIDMESPGPVDIVVTPAGGRNVENTGPVVDAGADVFLVVPSGAASPYNVQLGGQVVDDGLPAGSLAILWEKTSGPGTVGFANASAESTEASFSAQGTYVLRLEAGDGALESADSVLVTIGSQYVPPVTPAAWWKFNEGSADTTVESVSERFAVITGDKTVWVAGVSGTAVAWDGYNTSIAFRAEYAPSIGRQLTLEAWIAVKAYPWNWCPIVHRSEWGSAGYYLGIDSRGHAGIKVHADGQWREVTSLGPVPRNRWVHVAGVYDGAAGNMRVFIDGLGAGSIAVPGGEILTTAEPVKIGKGINMLVTDRIREEVGDVPDSYAFDGLIDEVKIYNVALSDSQVADSYQAAYPGSAHRDNPSLQERVLPGAPVGPGHRFGAYYDTLKFYDTWDNLWRLGPDADVVVRFDSVPYKFIFWHGTSYVPHMVSENNKWSNNEFLETGCSSDGDSGIDGCGEPMSDKMCRHSHVRIIENNDARVVVQWRYGMVDVHDDFAYVDSYGWGDWGEEFYYIYPDGLVVRKQTLWTSAKNEWHEWHEAIVLSGPETRPEDNIEYDAVHLANIQGGREVYSWQNGLPDQLDGEDMPLPPDAHMHKVNLKSQWDHFTIFEQRKLYKAPEAYDGELTAASAFPWWNHWPVSQVTTDGRWAYEPDRTSHSSFDNVKWRSSLETDRAVTKLLLQGMTDGDILSLVPLARSWEDPPEMTVNTPGFSEGLFDRSQRAYTLTKTAAPFGNLSFSLAGSSGSPVINPCVVVHNMAADRLKLTVNGTELPAGIDFRWTVERHASGVPRLIVWARVNAESAVTFELSDPGLPTDLNGDGVVNFLDFALYFLDSL